ncbi:MAG: condensation domain-containing protein [Erysipelotrichaceae bacterium]
MTTYYPLTPSQKLMYYAMKYTPPQITNVGSTLWFEDSLDLERLQEAIALLYTRVDSLRLRLTKQKGKVVMYESEQPMEPVTLLQLQDQSETQIVATFNTINSELKPWKDVQLFQIILAQGPNHSTLIYMRVHHVVMDSYALIFVANELMALYEALVDNAPLPPLPSSFLAELEHEYAYHGSSKESQDRAYWLKQFENPPFFAALSPKDIGLPYRKGSLKNPQRYCSQYFIEQVNLQDYQAILHYAKTNMVSPYLLFMVGMFCYLAKSNQTDQVLLLSPLFRRDRKQRKKMGGMFISNLPFYVSLAPDVSFAQAIEQLSLQQMELYRHGDYPYGTLVQDLWKKHRKHFYQLIPPSYTDAMMTFQVGKIQTRYPYRLVYQTSGVCGTTIYLYVVDLSNRNVLDVIVEYRPLYISEAIAHAFTHQMLKVVMQGIQNPNIKMADLVASVELYQEAPPK